MHLTPSSVPAYFVWIPTVEWKEKCDSSLQKFPISRSIKVLPLSEMETTPRYVYVKFEWIPCTGGDVNFHTRVRLAASVV